MAKFRFSTDGVAAHEKLSAWREVFGAKIAKLDMEAPLNEPFHGAVTVAAFRDLAVGLTSTTANRIARTRNLVDDGSDDILLGIMLKGQAAVAQQGHAEVQIEVGEAVVWSNASMGYSQYSASVEFLSVAIPRALLVPSLIRPDGAGFSVIPARSEPLRLLTNYLHLMLQEDLPSELHATSVAYVHDLVAVALDGQWDALKRGKNNTHTARLHAVKHDIAQRLRDRDLSVNHVALRQGVAPRTIRALFAQEGLTFTEYVLNQRVSQVYRMLVDQRFSDRTISAIAFEFGFGDLSYFNLVFRRRYGATPSDIRAAGA